MTTPTSLRVLIIEKFYAVAKIAKVDQIFIVGWGARNMKT